MKIYGSTTMTILARTGSFGYTLRTNDEFLPKNASIIAAFVNSNGKVVAVTHSSNELTRKGVATAALQSMPRTFKADARVDSDRLKAVTRWVTINDEHLTNVIAAAIDHDEVPTAAMTAAMTELIDSDSLPTLDVADLWAQFRTRGPVGREVARRAAVAKSLAPWSALGYNPKGDLGRVLA